MAAFDIIYVDMGPGDCTLVKCPDGKVVMIDCGSSGGMDEDSFGKAQNTLNAWLKGNPLIQEQGPCGGIIPELPIMLFYPIKTW